MIPDHLIDKALMAALGDLSGHHPIVRARWELTIEAALEAVAADIWEEGENIGYVHGQHDAHRFEPGPDYRETPNPYRASETK